VVITKRLTCVPCRIPAVHFFFGQRQDDKDNDNIETVSLKNNPVLIALSEGRLPDERPNYEYFAQILTLNEQVTVRPKRCWIFVSHQDVVVAEDGDGYVPATGEKLSESEYPHLVRNLERETWAKEEQQIFKGGLLHEFTKEIHQVESSSVREISRKWETAFPSLYQRLEAITATTTDAQCDILHMHVTLELKERRRFPSQSELNSWVEINIEQPRLLNHRWKVHTVLARPEELSYSHDDAPPELLYETSAEIAMQYQHRPGCEGAREGGGQCDCISQRCRRDYVTVPFPADVWALTLTNCAEYPAHPFSDGKRHDRGSGPIVKREDDHDGEPRSRRRNRQPTQMDLVPKIAMMQEIWSCPPSLPHERSQRWTRRALILWTFETIHSIEDGKLVTAQGGRTNWRFLTILDPASEYHQQRAIINPRRTSSSDGYGEHSSGLASGVPPSSRDIVTSPSPIYQPDMSASISENFAAWDNAGGLGTLSTSAAQAAYSAHLMAQTTASHTTTVQAGYDLLGSLNSHSGLATPPPSATLTTSFAPGFDTASNSAGIHPGYIPSHVAATTAGMDACSQGLGSNLAAVTDHFLAHVSNATYGESQDSIHSWSDHAIGSNMDSAAAWPSTYPSTSAIAGGSYSHSVAGAWTESQLQSAPARGSSEQRRSSSNAEQHQSQGQQQQQQQQQQQHHRQQQQLSQQVWIPSDTTGNEHDIWTPVTSAHTPGESAATATTTNTTQPGSSHDHHKAAGEAEWVLIHSTATSAAGCDSDLSQDWEEIAAPSSSVSSSSNSHSPFMPIETATRAVKVIAEAEEILRRHGGFPPRTATLMSRLKRRRSDSSVDGDEEQQEGETGVCRRRPRC
jgi:hypothetical protein